MVLSCQKISKSFGENTVLDNITFNMESNDKIGIVGINGAGKSTLLKIIMGNLTPSSGTVVFSKDINIGYLAQNDTLDLSNTIYEEMSMVKAYLFEDEKKMRELEKQMKNTTGEEYENLCKLYNDTLHHYEQNDGYSYKSELTGILKGLGFKEEEFAKKVSTLSGGQKTRVALGKILLSNPDLIILDEPTNHLDLNSVSWLETYLSNYKKAVLAVSHDRYFINKICNKIMEIENSKALIFKGDYSEYIRQKKIINDTRMKAYLNNQAQIKHEEAVIEKLKSFNREKSIKRAESREKLLNKIEVVEKPKELNQEMKIKLTPYKESGKDVLSVRNLSKQYGDKVLFEDASFEIKKGEHVAIIGANGTGKTTLLKILTGSARQDKGAFSLRTNVEIGYYDQEQQLLSGDKTLFDEISDDYPYLNNTQIRNTLAAFLFTQDDVFKLTSDLSGGEKGRLSLAKLMLSKSNFIILDEPTNHLDIISKEILEDALNSYEGTVLYVSHDRYFINKTASRILELKDKGFINYIGNYDYYLEKCDILSNSGNTERKVCEVKTEETAQKADWKKQKEEQAKQRKKENDLKKCEDRIEVLEAKLAEIETKMTDSEIATQMFKLMDLCKEQDKIKAELNELMELWETLSM
ncbi:MAG: ABC-F family ATP-binding cassette domain-containing protein [Lachnospiraceae bacterium]|nr:ABC-F family ATP-binding cassette domain-containing protein [Lachnospiraceae bacterium]